MTDSYHDSASNGSISGFEDALGMPKGYLNYNFRIALIRMLATRDLRRGSKDAENTDDALFALMLASSPPSLATITLVETTTVASGSAPENTWHKKLEESLAATLSGMVAANDERAANNDAKLNLEAA